MDIKGSTALGDRRQPGARGGVLPPVLLERGAATVYAGARDPASVTIDGVTPIKLDVTIPTDIACGRGELRRRQPAGEQRGDLDADLCAR